jgi:hypothetical protein
VYFAWNASVARSRSAEAVRCSARPGFGAGETVMMLKLIIKLTFCDGSVAIGRNTD